MFATIATSARNLIPKATRWWGVFLWLSLATETAWQVAGQDNVTQNNLIQNGGFDSGSTGWSYNGSGNYFYNQVVGSETDSILSIGWVNGQAFWQTTSATFQPGTDYLLTIHAVVGQSPLTGVNIGVADATQGFVNLTNRTFTFPDQTQTWRIFSLYVSSNTIAANLGDTIGVAGSIVENPSTRQGWLWVDWMQLTPTKPYFSSQPASATNSAGTLAGLSAVAIGAVTNTTSAGSVLSYQWYKSPGTLVPNATNATLAFGPAAVTNSGTFYVVATGSFGSAQSSNALLTVLPQTLPTVAVDPTSVLVDNFTGWGTSLCWWANVVGGYANREAYAQLAFSANNLGLNLVRYNIGGGENPSITNTMEFRAQMQGFEPTNGVWNWNADQNQRWMLKRAVQLGANHVVAFANSPPWWMTVSGSVTGSTNGTGDNLQTSYETNFASYLAIVISNLTVLDGVHFDIATPMNEPTGYWWVYGGRQEGCHMGAAQQARVVNDLRAALTAQNLATGIDASEDTDEQDTINSVNSYGSAQTNVTILASHTYGANNPTGLHNLAVSLHIPDWISEYGDGDGTGITMARRIHDDITQAQVQAWTYWQVMDGLSGWAMICNVEDDSGNTSYTFNEKYYVMWQFSHFIRPGDKIITAADTNSLVAYDATNHCLIFAIVNDSANGFSYDYDLTSFGSVGTNASGWRTSSTERGAVLPPVTITNQQLVAYLAPMSVTTYVIPNVILNTQPLAWYPLDSNAVDVSGNGNNATLATNVTYVPGKIGAGAAQFTGSNSYTVIPRSISNSFTITCWIKTTTTGGGPHWWAGKGIVDGEVQGSTSDFGLSLVGGAAAFGIGNPDTTITSTTLINDGQWHHIAAEWNALTGLMQLYADGQLQVATIGPTGTRSAPPNLRLGSIQSGYGGGFLAGTIDDVRLFNRTLSAAEVIGTMSRTPTLSPIANQVLIAGQSLVFTNQAADPDLPAQILTWSLASAPAGTAIQTLNVTNAIFTWRPTIAQSPSTNVLSVIVTDNGTPSLSATQSFSVTVMRPASPQMQSPAWTGHAFTLKVTGGSGPDYIVDATTNLSRQTSWTPLATNLSATLPWVWTDISASNNPTKFYRIRLGP